VDNSPLPETTPLAENTPGDTPRLGVMSDPNRPTTWGSDPSRNPN